MLIDISQWKKFLISKIFTTKYPVARSIKKYTSGNMPYVSSSSVNNGIISYLQPKNNEDYELGNCITINPIDGKAFYQEKNFLCRGGSGSSVILLYNKNLNKYNALFICTIIKMFANKFNYQNLFNSNNLKLSYIYLPIVYNDKNIVLDDTKEYSDDGFIPNWQYMESYMKQILDNVKNDVEILKDLIS